MRARALFAMMFGLGVGAVFVGTTVSRLVVGPALNRDAGRSPPVVAEPAPGAVSSIPVPPVTSSVPAPPAVASAQEPAVEPAPPRRRGFARRHLRATADEAPVASVPVAQEERPLLLELPADTADTEGEPIAIVRGGAASRGGRVPGPQIIRIDPENGER